MLDRKTHKGENLFETEVILNCFLQRNKTTAENVKATKQTRVVPRKMQYWRMENAWRTLRKI